MKLTDCITSEQITPCNYIINFNVYVSSQQKKSDLGDPNFRVILCRLVESSKFFIKIRKQMSSKKESVVYYSQAPNICTSRIYI